MAKPELVTSVARSKKIVSTILMTEEPVAVIALTFKTNAITGIKSQCVLAVDLIYIYQVHGAGL